MTRLLAALVLLVVVGQLSACSTDKDSVSSPQAESVETTATVVVPTQSPTSLPPAPQTTVAAIRPLSTRETQQATGVVVAVDGDLSEVRSFTILLDGGTTIDILTQAGLLFDGGPISHVRDHMVSGAPITVDYHIEGGLAVASSVGDAE